MPDDQPGSPSTSRPTIDALRDRAQVIADRLIAIDNIVAVVLAGSLSRVVSGEVTDPTDRPGDIDLHVYVADRPPLDQRLAAIADLGGSGVEADRAFWELDDTWVDGETGTLVEVMYRWQEWIEDEVPRRMERHEAAIGYTTSVVDSIHGGIVLQDPSGWFARMQAATAIPYPDGLRAAIVTKNWLTLRTMSAGYRYQLRSAVRRDDANAVTNRVAAVLDAYWDILFALNGAFHPGEKRIVAHVSRRCPDRPADLDGMVRRLLTAAAPGNHADVLPALDALLDDLDGRIVRVLGALPAWPPDAKM